MTAKIKINLIGWEENVAAMEMAAFAGENVLLVAKPGTSKSLMARQFFGNMEGRVFATQISKWSDETQLFGLPDMTELKKGNMVFHGKGTLLDCDYAFLDELFDGSDALLRTTLGPLHERVFSRGGATVKMPMQMAVATSNYTRINTVTEAVLDRFLVQLPAPKLDVRQLTQLLKNGSHYETWESSITVTKLDLDTVRKASMKVTMDDEQMKALVEQSVRLSYSPRRLRKVAVMARIAAAMDGRKETLPADVQVSLISTIPVQMFDARDRLVMEINERFATIGLEKVQLEEIEGLLSSKLPSKASARLKVIADMNARLTKMIPCNDTVKGKRDEMMNKLGVLYGQCRTAAEAEGATKVGDLMKK